MSLTPFQCPACHAAVPLVDTEQAVCPFCGQDFETPPEYLALRAAEIEHARAAARAQALFAVLGKPPRLLYRTLAGWFGPGALMLGMFPASFVVGVGLVYGTLWAVQLVIPINLLDVVPETEGDWASVFSGLVFVWTGALVGVAGTQRALVLGPLQSALAAQPPDRPGGGANCRLCGAPLTYGPTDLGVRCAFCHGDNLLQIPPRWAKGLADANLQVGKAIESVESAWSGELARLVRFRRNVGLGLLAATAFFLWAFSGVLGGHRELPGSWQAMTRGEGKVLLVTAVRHGEFWYSESTPAELHGGVAELTLRTTGPYCSDALCRVYVNLPGRRGETWSMTCSPGGAPLHVAVHSGSAHVLQAWERGWPGEYGPTVAQGNCAQGVKFATARTGWHLVGIDLPGRIDMPLHITLRRRP